MACNSALTVTVDAESWPLREPFVISRGPKSTADVVVVKLEDRRGYSGFGECVPYARYGETVEGVIAAIRAWVADPCHVKLAQTLAAGAARNAIDSALYDLESRQTGRPVAARLGLPAPRALETAFTLSLGRPGEMAAKAGKVSDLGLLKLKLAGDGLDEDRMRAVRQARPGARLIGDANEAWREHEIAHLLGVAAQLGFEMIEQPLASGGDAMLSAIARPLPVCADESFHVSGDAQALSDRYDAVNIKLDKAGGLSEALTAAKVARAAGLKVMAGSMVSTSLSIAPAFLLAQDADWVDLDSPLLLSRDRAHGFRIEKGWMAPAEPGLWGDGAAF